MMMKVQTQLSLIALCCVSFLITFIDSVETELNLGNLPDLTKEKGKTFEIAGTVRIVSDRVIEVDNFNYAGGAPDPFFWIHPDPEPTVEDGVILQDTTPSNSCGTTTLDPVLADGQTTYRLEIPEGYTIYDFEGGSISVYCRAMFVNLGSVEIPEDIAELAVLPVMDDDDMECMGTGTDRFGLYDRIVKPIRYIFGMARNFIFS